MGTYISPEMIQNRQITNSYRNMINDLNAPGVGQSNQITQNIWNAASNAMGSNMNNIPFTSAPSISASINNSTDALMNSMSQTMPTPQPTNLGLNTEYPVMAMLNNSTNQLMNLINQPVNTPVLQNPTILNSASNPMTNQMSAINQQAQSFMNNLNPSATMPGATQVDPVTGQPVNAAPDAYSNMAQKYNNVATIMNDPRQQAKLNMLSEQIKGCLKDGWFDDRDEVNQVMTQLKPEELAALEIVYGQKSGNPTQLREDFRKHFAFLSPGRTAPDEVKILNQAALASPSNAALAIKDAVNGQFANIDKDTLNQIISTAEPVFLSQVAMEYQQATGKALTTELKEKLWWAGGDNNNLLSKVTSALAQDKTRSGYF